MKYLRTAAVVLCAFLLLTTITVSAFDSVAGIDLNAAMTTYTPDTVMLRAGEVTVSWGMFYFFLFNEIAQITGGFQTDDIDWYEPSPDGAGTLSDLLKEYVISQVSQSLPYDYGVIVNNITLSPDDLRDLDESLDNAIEQAGGFRMFEATLRSGGFYNFETYRNILIDITLQNKLPTMLYGENFDRISDEDALSFAEEIEFMRAKHILLSFPDVQGDELEAAKEEILAQAEEILAELAAHIGDDDFLEIFDTLMYEYSQDPGSFSNPLGYLFQPADMVPEFSAACAALEVGTISDVVESSYGYHIILRLPLDLDNMIPIAYAQAGQSFTLRQMAVLYDFEKQLFNWTEAMGDIMPTPELESLDVGKLFS